MNAKIGEKMEPPYFEGPIDPAYCSDYPNGFDTTEWVITEMIHFNALEKDEKNIELHLVNFIITLIRKLSEGKEVCVLDWGGRHR